MEHHFDQLDIPLSCARNCHSDTFQIETKGCFLQKKNYYDTFFKISLKKPKFYKFL